jgi:thiol-disulfide isomerase/thioredoxin
MRSLILAISLLLLAPRVAAAEVNEGDRAAELVNAKTASGRAVKLKSYRGKWVVVTFGASWCKPCKAELPAWEKLAKAYKAAGKPVVFIAVNIDQETAKGRKFVSDAGLSAMIAAFEPSGASAESYDPPTMPSTYVVDPNGLVRERHEGYRSGDEGKLRGKLDGFLK